MRIKPESEETSIVVAGNLNPAIFTPAWLQNNDLVEEDELDDDSVEVVHPDITIIKADWFRLQVERHRFHVASLRPPAVRIHDLACRVFGDLLTHTPLGAVGINFTVDFPVKDYEAIHRLGDAVAPKNPWGAWGELLANTQVEGTKEESEILLGRGGGLFSMTMREAIRQDGLFGHVNVTLRASQLCKPGLRIEVNDHYQAASDNSPIDARKCIGIVVNKFDWSLDRSKWIIDELMETVAS